MSRWIEQYQNHAFRTSWVGLRKSLSTSKVDDETVVTTVKELGRLKKAIAFIDEMINGIDPELVPLSTWDLFQTQADSCVRQIDAFNSNRSVAHLAAANSHADNLLTYVRPYMVWKGKVGKALRDAALAYSTVIDEISARLSKSADELVSELSRSNKEGTALLEASRDSEAQLASALARVTGGAGETGILGDIEEAQVAARKKYDEISELHDATIGTSDGEPTMSSELLDAKKAILADKEQLGVLVAKSDASIQGLEKFHATIFGVPDPDGVRAGGLSANLEKRIEVLGSFEVAQKARYEALNLQIEDLLPGATSAGLASAYTEMKNSFKEQIDTASKTFYLALILFLGVSIFFSPALAKVADWSELARALAQKIPFYVPILWLAYYATTRRSEFQRLQQEYAHKEALAKSYDSYKRQLEALDSEDKRMQKDFIMKAVDAIARNASETLDGKHGDKMPAHDLIEKIAKAIIEVQKEGAAVAK